MYYVQIMKKTPAADDQLSGKSVQTISTGRKYDMTSGQEEEAPGDGMGLGTGAKKLAVFSGKYVVVRVGVGLGLGCRQPCKRSTIDGNQILLLSPATSNAYRELISVITYAAGEFQVGEYILQLDFQKLWSMLIHLKNGVQMNESGVRLKPSWNHQLYVDIPCKATLSLHETGFTL